MRLSSTHVHEYVLITALLCTAHSMSGGLSGEEGTGEGAVARHRGPHIQVHPLPESRASGPGTVVLGRRLTSLTGRFVALPAHLAHDFHGNPGLPVLNRAGNGSRGRI